jgi:hypothetical protein
MTCLVVAIPGSRFAHSHLRSAGIMGEGGVTGVFCVPGLLPFRKGNRLPVSRHHRCETGLLVTGSGQGREGDPPTPRTKKSGATPPSPLLFLACFSGIFTAVDLVADAA